MTQTYVSHCMMQHTATHCNTLQHTATHCNTLQHTYVSHCMRVYIHTHDTIEENTPYVYILTPYTPAARDAQASVGRQKVCYILLHCVVHWYSHIFVFSHPTVSSIYILTPYRVMHLQSHTLPCHVFTFLHRTPVCPYCSPQKLKEDSDLFFQKLQGSPIWRGRKGDTNAHVYLDTPDLPFEKYEGRIPQKSVRKAFYIADFVAS